MLVIAPLYGQVNHLVINEFMALNEQAITDEFGEFNDWIELYNSGNVSVNLSGLYLTDDLHQPQKFALPDTSLPSKAFLIIWADKDIQQGELHANFKLNKSGEEIGLSNGSVFLDSLIYGEQMADVSFGRLPDGTDKWMYFYIPTPGHTNEISAPQHFCAIPGERQITLLWSSKIEGLLDHYNIFRSINSNFNLLAEVLPPDTFYIDTNVVVGETYSYRISATSQAGVESGFSPVIKAVVADSFPPSKPTGLSTVSKNERVLISWDPNKEADLAYYIVYRSQTHDFTPTSLDSIAEVEKTYSHHEDITVENSELYYYRIVAVDYIDNKSEPSEVVAAYPEEAPPYSSKLPVYHINILQKNLDKLNEDIYSDEYVPATVILEETCYYDVGIRYRGLTSRDAPKKSYKINFKTGNRFKNRDKMNLKSEYCDMSLMREHLSFECLSRVGLHASETRHIHLRLNDEFIGVYLDVENIDEFFFSARNMDESGSLYKAADQGNCTLRWRGENAEDYMGIYEKKIDEYGSWEDFIDFVYWINFSSDEEFLNEVETRLKLDLYLEWVAVNHIVENFDVYHKNYYLYHDPTSGLWEIIPYDYDYAFGHIDPPNLVIDNPLSIGTRNMLFKRIYETPQLRKRMESAVIKNLNTLFNTNEILPTIDTLYNLIREDAYLDTNKASTNEEFDYHYQLLKDFVELRTNFILNELTPQQIYINEVMAHNETVIADEYGEYDSWIEIYNANWISKNLKYYFLTDSLQHSKKWAFPDTTIPAYGRLLIWADGQDKQGKLHTNFKLNSSGGIIGIFEDDNIVDAIKYSKQEIDYSYGRSSDGGRGWQQYIYPTPGEGSITLNYHFPEQGWYLISLSVDAPEKDVAALFPSASGVFAWRDTGYVSVTELEIGEGYWIYIPQPIEYSISGNRIFSYKSSFNKGWHLVGAPGKRTNFSDPHDTPDCAVIAAFTWNTSNESYFSVTFLEPNSACWIYVHQNCELVMNINSAGTQSIPKSTNFFPPGPPSINGIHINNKQAPICFKLEQNYPNPFNLETTISYHIPLHLLVSLKIYNTRGQLVAILIEDKEQKKGYYKLNWNSLKVSSGVYFFHLKAGKFQATQKMVILK